MKPSPLNKSLGSSWNLDDYIFSWSSLALLLVYMSAVILVQNMGLVLEFLAVLGHVLYYWGMPR